ncbi:hypothetical protein SAMN05421810_103607 [Amycolatopsis arida]|uniref:Uncharacterized protein n=1 Tax=Amycolatopsis arida TaxID=587909 RepID=A0A1I5TPU4_9PSEU|nr:hypothetical protein [Amycolatopsis arida]TDX96015.1 hypothetical protein CLV69_103150 [Amycolatopsis arida]SFP85084.1 hypothetical protein SAMN05421810_103607 [Amycolatopsis arida]
MSKFPPIPLGRADWARAWRGLAAPVTAVARGRRRPLRLLVSVPVFLLSLLVWYLVARVATYGLFWNADTDHAESWGGPTLAGAWLVHALIGLALVLAALGLLRPLSRVLARPTT